MIPTNNHNEPILEPLFDYKCEKQEVDPSISIVASMENTIKKVAIIKKQIEELAEIKEQIIEASTLDSQDIVTLIVLLGKLNENNGLEVLKSQPSKNDLEQIKIVNGGLPAIKALTDRNYEGIEYPLKALVDIYKNFNTLTSLINNLQKLLELWNSKDHISKLSVNLGLLEQVSDMKASIDEITLNAEAILMIKAKMNELLKVSEKIEAIEKVIDLEAKIDEILANKTEIEAVYNNLDIIKRVHQSIHNVDTLAQNIDKLN